MSDADGKPAERRLGRGLEALLGQAVSGGKAGGNLPSQKPIADEKRAEEAPADPVQDGGLFQVNVYQIDTNPYQPRTEFDEEELNSLAESLSDHGLLQPIVVRKDGDRYQLISGERRWRAAIQAGWTEVPATLREADDQQVAEMTIVENLQRKDLGPLEKAVSFRQYLERFGASQDELARRLSIDRSTVANLIRLLELPLAVQELIRDGSLSAGHGRALLPLGEEQDQLKFARQIRSEQLSVRATERLVAERIRNEDDPHGLSQTETTTKTGDGSSREHLVPLEQKLRSALGTSVDIREVAKGRGTIVIHFTSREEFDRLYHELLEREGRDRMAG
ncbi:MAG: ParB/RepB/Spo0J family partition protein [Arenicellales bacterium]|nr:ParB/RepB/Spo0J family partition protein [Arenicellales bacterium]